MMWFCGLVMLLATCSSIRSVHEEVDDIHLQDEKEIHKFLGDRGLGHIVNGTQSGPVAVVAVKKGVEADTRKVNRMIALYGAGSFEAIKHDTIKMLAFEAAEYGAWRFGTQRSEVPSLQKVHNPAVIFVKSNSWLSAGLRADEAAYILNNMSATPAVSMDCNDYRALFCATRSQQLQTVQIVVHVKFVCACPGRPRLLGAVQANHVYDPIDYFDPTGSAKGGGGLRQGIQDNSVGIPPCKRDGSIIKNSCFSAFLTANRLMREGAKEANADAVAYVVQHHHSNFHNRHRVPSEESSAKTVVGIAGHKLSSIVVDTSYAGNLDYKRVDDLVESSGCSPEDSPPPSPRADCYAKTFQRIALGIAWNQEEGAFTRKSPKAIDNSAQRLLNLFAVGVPAIGHSNYASYREVADRHGLLRTTSSEATLRERLEYLALNQTAYAEASAQALQVAQRYSPEATGRRYRQVFSKLGLTV